MKKFLFRPLCLAGALLIPLFLPDAALAWGPGVHMVTGNWLLQNLALFPQELAAAIAAHPGLFLQGCLSADIFIGKGCVAREGHSHNWQSGLDLLDKAHTRGKLAYACGYLSHLAADTVAHNVFVPGSFQWGYSLEAARDRGGSRIVNPPRTYGLGRGKMAHILMEMRADSAVIWDRRQALQTFNSAGSKGTERMLMRAFNQKYWLFQLKKNVYRSSIALGCCRPGAALQNLRGLGNLRGLAGRGDPFGPPGRAGKKLRLPPPAYPLNPLLPGDDFCCCEPEEPGKGLILSPGEARRAKKLIAPPGVLLGDLLVVSARAMADVLRNPYGSRVLALDPVGTRALARAARGLGPGELAEVSLGGEEDRAGTPPGRAGWPKAAAEVLLELPPVPGEGLRGEVKREP